MLCQNCQKRIASVHLTQVINSNKVEMHLCEHCAKEKGSFGIGSPLNLNDFISGIMGFKNSASYGTAVPQTIACDKCGMSNAEFQKTGKLGCMNCYEAFTDSLKPLVKRLHGNTEHNGKAPSRISKSFAASKELSRLKEQLNKAVLSEEYEKAAQIRDKIRTLEANA